MCNISVGSTFHFQNNFPRRVSPQCGKTNKQHATDGNKLALVISSNPSKEHKQWKYAFEGHILEIPLLRTTSFITYGIEMPVFKLR